MSKLSFLEHAFSNGWLLAHAPTVLLCQSSLLLFLIDNVAIPTCLRVSSYVWMLTPQRYPHISALILQIINEIKSLLTLKQPLSPSLFLPLPPFSPSGSSCLRYHLICSLPPRQAEEVFVEERDSDVPGHEWERVARLCDFNPKNNKNTKDVSRMRSLFLQLKQTPPVH